MNTARCLGFLIAVLIFAGCGKQEQASAPAPAPPPAQNSYLGAMVKAQQSAVKVVDVTSLNHEVELFNVQEGRYPKDLNELVTSHYIGALPTAPVGMKIVYDATSGKVTVVKQ